MVNHLSKWRYIPGIFRIIRPFLLPSSAGSRTDTVNTDKPMLITRRPSLNVCSDGVRY